MSSGFHSNIEYIGVAKNKPRDRSATPARTEVPFRQASSTCRESASTASALAWVGRTWTSYVSTGRGVILRPACLPAYPFFLPILQNYMKLREITSNALERLYKFPKTHWLAAISTIPHNSEKIMCRFQRKICDLESFRSGFNGNLQQIWKNQRKIQNL